jgi:carbon-monoxide dehydrogenase catalytic subunit
MAMRMMLIRNMIGTSTYHYHTDQTIKTLRAAAKGHTLLEIRELEKLMAFAERFRLDTSGSPEEVALRLCDFVEADFNRKYYEPSRIVEALAPDERKEVWRKLKAMRLSIAMAYQSQIVNEYCQDVIYGIPRPHRMRVDLGVLDPDYVNVLPNGHEPFLGFAMVQLARKQEWQDKAKAVGAKGLRVIANIESGQEMIQRWEMDDVFYGFTGNWISQEAVLASGCVDLFAADLNCSMPVDPLYADKYKFRLVPVSELVAFEGVTERINYVPEKAEEQAAQLLQMAIDNFKERRSTVDAVPGLPIKEAVVGFSSESILEELGGTLDPLLDAIKKGTLRGIASLVSCTSLRDGGQDVHTVAVTKELIKRDILVLSMGCGNAALQVAGLCTPEAREYAGPGLKSLCELLGIPPALSYGTCTDVGRIADLLAAISNALGGVSIPDLPVVGAAPEYMEQKATIDAVFALALGLYTYVNPVPTVTGGPNLVRLLTEDCEQLTGGRLNVEKDPVRAVDAILEHIEGNRKKSGM